MLTVPPPAPAPPPLLGLPRALPELERVMLGEGDWLRVMEGERLPVALPLPLGTGTVGLGEGRALGLTEGDLLLEALMLVEGLPREVALLLEVPVLVRGCVGERLGLRLAEADLLGLPVVLGERLPEGDRGPLLLLEGDWLPEMHWDTVRL